MATLEQVEATSQIFSEVGRELARADKHGDFNSLHEAYAVIEEEMDEVWDITKLKKRNRNKEALKAELIQVAAMAIKAIENIDNFVGGEI